MRAKDQPFLRMNWRYAAAGTGPVKLRADHTRQRSREEWPAVHLTRRYNGNASLVRILHRVRKHAAPALTLRTETEVKEIHLSFTSPADRGNQSRR